MCVWREGAGIGALCTLEKAVQREQFLSAKLETANATGLLQPGGNALYAPQENLPCCFLIPCCLLNPSINVLQ